jgi:uncharacterized Zn-finger protein
MSSMMVPQAPEIIQISQETDQVYCDGGHGALGHPRVWYSFAGQDSVTCMYCDRLFLKKSV